MRRFFQRFRADQQGNILILAGIGILFLVGIGGAGYDLGRQQLVRQKIQQAADAAALAAAGMDFGTSDGTRQNTAQAFFALNYPQNYLGVTRPTPRVTIANEQVTVSATTSVPTSFVGNFGISTIAAAGTSRTQFKRAQTTVDVILVMDNSGSMGGTDVAATSFLQGNLPVMIAGCVAEFGSAEQLAYYTALYLPCCGPTYGAFLVANFVSQCKSNPNFIGYPGATRINALRFAADDLAKNLLNPNPANNQVALVKWDNTLVGSQNLTTSYATTNSALMSMYAGAGTKSTVGLSQAESIGNAGFRTGVAHAVVLLTDGLNLFPTVDNPASLAICNRFKAQGTIVYAIGFGTDLNSPTNGPVIRQFLSDCATGPNGPSKPNLNTFYFEAPDAASLTAAFAAIGGSLKKVQIIQ